MPPTELEYTIIPEGERFRVQRSDGTLTKGRFHTQAQAEQWVAGQPAYHRQALMEVARTLSRLLPGGIYSLPEMQHPTDRARSA